MDSHAQVEIQEYARAMYELIKPIVPIAVEAFQDYVIDGIKLSRMEKNFIQSIVDSAKHNGIHFFNEEKTDAENAKGLGMSVREFTEFKKKFNI